MAKFKEAINRLFNGIYVCRKCKSKRKGTSKEVINKTLKCRKCKGKVFRPIKKSK